jgi:hypothetical protein
MAPIGAIRAISVIRAIRAIGAIAAIAVAGLALGCRPATGRAAAPGARPSLELTAEPLVIRHLLTGELEAAEAVQFITPNVGQWPLQVQRLLPNGARVSAGDVVVEFDNSNLLTTVDTQQSAVIRAQAELAASRSLQAEQVREKELALAQRKAEAEKARIAASVPEGLKADIEYERLQLDLRRAELMAEEARDSLDSSRAAAQAEIGIKEVQLERAWADLRHAERSLDQVVLRAPTDGILVVHNNRQQDRTFQTSDAAQPGEPVASLPNLETLRVRARLFDVDEGDLRTGAAATVTLDAYPEHAYDGVVREIQQVAQQPSRRSSRRTFDVLVELSDLDLDLMLPGMSAKITVEETIDRDEHGCELLLAPRQALALGGDLLGAPVAEGGGGRPGSGLRHQGVLHLADGSTVEVEVGRCNATHCIVGHDIVQDMVQDIAQDIAQDIVQDTAQDIVQDTAQDTVQDTVQDTAQDTVQDIAQDIAQDAAQDTAQDAARGGQEDDVARAEAGVRRLEPGTRLRPRSITAGAGAAS